MGVEFSPQFMFWAKAIASIVALLTAYGAKGDGFRKLLAKFTTARAQQHAAEATKDTAWRELMDDSIERDCAQSVDLLNEWMKCRTAGRLTKAK